MAEFAKIMAIRKRMCDKLGCGINCPLNHCNTGISCGELVYMNPKKYEDIILKWDAENPVKTNKDKFEEVFGVKTELRGCNGINCPDDPLCETCKFKDFWKKEYKENNYGGNDQYT